MDEWSQHWAARRRVMAALPGGFSCTRLCRGRFLKYCLVNDTEASEDDAVFLQGFRFHVDSLFALYSWPQYVCANTVLPPDLD